MDQTNGYVQLQEPEVKHFVNYCLLGGAKVRRMDILMNDPFWPGYCNPSILYDGKTGNYKMIIRNVNYVLHGSQHPYKCPSSWGPVLYSVPKEDSRNLKTINFLGESSNPMDGEWKFQVIQTTPYTPKWEFQGQEDARLVRWNDRLYTTGVRRDDNPNGCGRMELMHISDTPNQESVNEISRRKVKALNEDAAYCEKNWMPILDLPYHYVQMTNPTVVVKTNPNSGLTEEVVRKEKVSGLIDEKFDLLRGSSQVIRWGDKWLALVHTCELWFTANNRKYARYCHCFVVWDNNWNIIKVSPLFSFADYNVEFTCGLCYHDGKFLIPFALQDNFPFLMEVDEEIIRKFIYNDESVKLADKVDFASNPGEVASIFKANPTPGELYKIGMKYFEDGQYAAAYCIFTHSADLFEYTYAERFYAARSIASLGHRDHHEIGMWYQLLEHNVNRPEAYMAIAMYYHCRGANMEASFFAKSAMKILEQFRKRFPNKHLIYYTPEEMEKYYNVCLMETMNYPEAIPYFDKNKMEHNENRRVL